MIRTVLAVILAIALLTATLPAIETVRVDRVDQSISDDLSAIDRASSELLATEERVDGPGAQCVVTVTVPDRGLVTAELQNVKLSADKFTYTIAGQQEQTVTPEAPIIRPSGAGPLQIGTSTDILLRLTADNGTRKIVMTRIGVPLNRSSPPPANETPENRSENSTTDPTPDQGGESESDDGSLWEWVTGIGETILEFIP